MVRLMGVSGSETDKRGGRSWRLCEKVCIKFPFPLIVWRAGPAPHALILLGPGSRSKGVTHTPQGPLHQPPCPPNLFPKCSHKPLTSVPTYPTLFDKGTFTEDLPETPQIMCELFPPSMITLVLERVRKKCFKQQSE